MIPEERFSTEPVRGGLLNPWSRDPMVSLHWGPVQVEDTSEGMLARLWTLRVEGGQIILSADGVGDSVLLDRPGAVQSVNLAFDQNARPCVCFEEDGEAFLYWYDPLEAEQVIAPLAAGTVSPRVTLDDARQFNIAYSDIILAYVRAGVIRYRRQRDRFQTEYTPPVGDGGEPVEAVSLHHVSMNSSLRLEFIADSEVAA